MGATGHSLCPGTNKNATNYEGLHLGFPQQIQQLIDGLRLKHHSKVQNMKNQAMPYGKLYRGSLVGGRKNGYGQFYNGQNAYFGLFENDLPHGEGLLVRQYKDYIIGNFSNGKPEGQVKQKLNNYYFHGHYYNGQKTRGVLKTENYIYEGSFKDNKFNEYGIIQFKNGERYEGDFINGLYHGYGKYETKQQGSYHGQFKNGVYDGKGKFIWSQDYHYEGQYKNGLRNGFGKFTKGQEQYDGFWINGQPQSNSKFLEPQYRVQQKIASPGQTA